MVTCWGKFQGCLRMPSRSPILCWHLGKGDQTQSWHDRKCLGWMFGIRPCPRRNQNLLIQNANMLKHLKHHVVAVALGRSGPTKDKFLMQPVHVQPLKMQPLEVHMSG